MKRSDLPMLGRTLDERGNTHYLFGGRAALHIWTPAEIDGFVNPMTGNPEKALVFTVPVSEFKDIPWGTLAEIGKAEQAEREAARAAKSSVTP